MYPLDMLGQVFILTLTWFSRLKSETGVEA